MKKLSRLQALLTIAVLAAGTVSIAKADHGDNGKDGETGLRTRLAGAAIQGKTPEGSADFRIDKNQKQAQCRVRERQPSGRNCARCIRGRQRRWSYYAVSTGLR